MFATLRAMPRASRASAAASVRAMSSTAKVWVDENTKVICQGFTGKQVRHRPTTLAASLCRWFLPGFRAANRKFPRVSQTKCGFLCEMRAFSECVSRRCA